MPVYVFKCAVCGAEQEVHCKHSERPEKIVCVSHWRKTPDDERLTMSYTMSPGNFVVKGFNEKNGYSGDTQ